MYFWIITKENVKWQIHKLDGKNGDYIRLGKAVSNFNKKIRSLENEQNKLVLPDIVDYKDVKEGIQTRKELNRFINSLRRFQQDDASQIYETEAGEIITKWERQEIAQRQRIATRRLNKELKELNEPSINGFSRVQMGSIRAREIENTLKGFKNIEKKTGSDFTRLKERIFRQGRYDYSMRRSIVYRENYIQEMEKYSSFENYDKLMNKLKSIKNPEAFYEFVSKNELTKDLTYNSDMFYSQAEFNRFVSDVLGEDVEGGEDLVKDLMDFKFESYKNENIEF